MCWRLVHSRRQSRRVPASMLFEECDRFGCQRDVGSCGRCTWICQLRRAFCCADRQSDLHQSSCIYMLCSMTRWNMLESVLQYFMFVLSGIIFRFESLRRLDKAPVISRSVRSFNRQNSLLVIDDRHIIEWFGLYCLCYNLDGTHFGCFLSANALKPIAKLSPSLRAGPYRISVSWLALSTLACSHASLSPCLVTIIESGLRDATFDASSTASGTKDSCDFDTLLAIRYLAASSALKNRPAIATSLAIVIPANRTSRDNPPAPAYSPRIASGRPKVALGEATIISQPRHISNPPPMAQPLTAAMTGFLPALLLIPMNPLNG